MRALENDPDIRDAPFSLQEKLTIQQVRFVGARLRDLVDRYESASREERLRPIYWAEWSVFMNAAHSCGFVCRDEGEDMGDPKKTPVLEFMRKLVNNLELVESLCLRDLRRILHYAMRSERWGDGGAGTGGGTVWALITSRLGNAIARRLGA
ncbi:MAG: hypothetical protein JJ869_05615 [Marivita sp.]|uniref:hypothetical protein n=1 Tax=Marivita sp. TaxID=2003365 RepID=UPI001B2DE163|nr:hypothetical protein [Marivita sp.]MBO6883045.1 hypothetical protein [Marivita sp.]